MEFISIDGLRVDGRRPPELRRVKHEVGTMSHVDGSAILEMGLSKVLATVVGPKGAADRQQTASNAPRVYCTLFYAPFSGGLRRVRTRTDRRLTHFQHALQNLVEQSLAPGVLQSCELRVGVTVLEADGGVEACAVNACMLALADAGVPLQDVTVACTAGVLQGQMCLDLNHSEESSGCQMVLLAWQPSLDSIVLLHCFSRMSDVVLGEMIAHTQTGCAKVYEQLQLALNEQLRKLAIGAGTYAT